MKTIRQSELTAFLKAIESGEILLTSDSEPQQVYAGNVRYAAANGWHVIIFNDANEWDYIDSIEDARGNKIEEVEFPSGRQIPLFEFDYTPSTQVAWDRYRIPGYMTFRCIQCGAPLSKRLPGTPFRCDKCAKELL